MTRGPLKSRSGSSSKAHRNVLVGYQPKWCRLKRPSFLVDRASKRWLSRRCILVHRACRWFPRHTDGWILQEEGGHGCRMKT